MQINFKVKTLDAQTINFSVDNEMTVREFQDVVARMTNIDPAQQRIISGGRVLSDERQLKNFDVDGKVINVAERSSPFDKSACMGNFNKAQAVHAVNSFHRVRQEIHNRLRQTMQQQQEARARILYYRQLQRDFSQGIGAARPPNDDDTSEAGPPD